MFSHAFLIAEGTQKNEWLIRLTGNQSILGLCGVFVFFAISGFLVTQSFEQTARPAALSGQAGVAHFPRPVCRRLAVGLCAGAARHHPRSRRLFQPAGALSLCRRQHVARPERARIAGRHVRQQPGRARDQRVDVDLALRVHDVRDGAGAGRAAAAEAAGHAGCCWRSASPACNSRTRSISSAAGAGCSRSLPIGMILYRLRETRIFDGRIAALGARRPGLQRAVARVHSAVPAVRLLSGAVAGAQPALAGDPGGAVRRSLLWSLHLWLAGRGGGDLAARRPGRYGGRCSALALPATAALAFLSWHLVEQPALRLKPGAPATALPLPARPRRRHSAPDRPTRVERAGAGVRLRH